MVLEVWVDLVHSWSIHRRKHWWCLQWLNHRRSALYCRLWRTNFLCHIRKAWFSELPPLVSTGQTCHQSAQAASLPHQSFDSYKINSIEDANVNRITPEFYAWDQQH